MGRMIGQIELTEAEQELASKIIFNLENVRLEPKRAIENGEWAAALKQSLMGRRAIPESRLRYFADPEYNPGRSKSSLKDIFLRNAGTTEKMYRHPHFAPYLHYFVYGAGLPPAIKDAFFAKTQDHFVTQAQLVQFASHLVRSSSLARHPKNYRLKDMFYQLALDCDCDECDARAVRDAVMKVK